MCALELKFELAEELKKYGSLLPLKEKEGDQVLSDSGHDVSYRDLYEIICARVKELMRLVMLELPHTDYGSLIPSEIVITGGCANLPGIVEMTQAITRLPVRIGVLSTLNGVSSALLNDPAYATSVGLLPWKMNNDSTANQKGRQTKPAGIRGFFSSPVRIFR